MKGVGDYYEKQFFDVKTDENGRFYSDVYVRDIWDCDITKPLISGSKEYLKWMKGELI